MPNSFIKNVNDLAAKIPIIEEANTIFDEGVIPILEEIALLDLDQAILDLKKGNYLGNRKIDINLALNMTGVTEELLIKNPAVAEAIWTDPTKTVQYSSATVTFADGVVTELPFMFDGVATTVSTHGDLLAQLSRMDYVIAIAQVDTIGTITAVDSTTYVVTINGTAFTYNSDIDATVLEITAGIAAAINAGVVPVTAVATATTVVLTADVSGTSFDAYVNGNMAVSTTTANRVAGPVETAFLAKLNHTLMASFAADVVGEIVRGYDTIGQNSNLERITLHAVSGAFVDPDPVYYWAKTTSAFQTLSMRAGDIIKLGNDIDSIILLAARITEMLALQAKIPELVTNVDSLYANIAKLVTIHEQIVGLTAIYNDIKVGGTNYIQTVSTNIADISTVATDLNLGVNSQIILVGGNINNVNAVGTNITNVNTAATNIANINTTATNIANVNAVGADLLEPISEINTVATSIANVDTVATNITNVNSVATTIVPNIAEILLADNNALLAKDYATKVALTVETGTYSAKEHAIGDLTATGGSAKAWAIDVTYPDGATTSGSAKTWAAKDATTVDGILYSSKEYASGDATASGGSAKAWATDINSPDGTTSKSAKTLAAEAAVSATTATTKSNEIKNVSVGSTITGAAGTLASVVYNPTDGKFTFVVPQGNKGDKGDAFLVNAVGLFAGRSIYDGMAQGFSFLALDLSQIYFKLSAISGDWSIGAPFGKGDTGDTGATGNGILQTAFTSTTNPGGTASVGGYTDTYTITYTDATTDTFTVYNGKGVVSTLFTSTTDISGFAGQPGATDTYTITYTDTTTDDFLVYNGLDSDVYMSDLTTHTSNISNPHGVTQAQVGLGNVDNTSDANKPISTATQTALDLKALKAQTITTTTTYTDNTSSLNYKMYMDAGNIIMEEL